MIVLKFGGTSVEDAGRIGEAAEIVRGSLSRRPLVVVSALGGVTDLLLRAVAESRTGEHQRLEPVLADVERRHRWALSNGVEDAGRRHALGLEIEGCLEDLRQRLRSIRILGESTPRATDGVLAMGEALSSRLVAGIFEERGLPAVFVDAAEVIRTDDCFGCANVDGPRVEEMASARLLPLLERPAVPVIGGFIGATAAGEMATLGRGGSDTSAVVLGCALRAEEIQIWTDVDGLMSADPRWVPEAMTLPAVTYAEAAELAFYGARVLHPHSVAPAQEREIPIRVLNSRHPGKPGTRVAAGKTPGTETALASIASRTGLLRFHGRGARAGNLLVTRLCALFEERGLRTEVAAGSAIGACVAVSAGPRVEEIERIVAREFDVSVDRDRAIICVVGSRLEHDVAFRRRVLGAVAEQDPEALVWGASPISVTAIVPTGRLAPAVRGLHGRFFEEAHRV